MSDQGWISLFTAAVGGATSFAAIEFVYKELKDWRKQKREKSRTVDVNLEPLLRATDELAGKIRSMAERDFLPIRGRENYSLVDTDVASIVYLFVQFWAEVEILRIRNLSADIVSSEKGKQTQAFLNCLQSRRLRLIDRISQRALGETALLNGKTMNFVEFIRSTQSDPLADRWQSPLFRVLANLDRPEMRQRLLQFFVVLHAMIDTLDPQHLVTRDRPSIPNKLNLDSKKSLNYRVFGVYLKFVINHSKYLGPLN
jgi:hypothetical protein